MKAASSEDTKSRLRLHIANNQKIMSLTATLESLRKSLALDPMNSELISAHKKFMKELLSLQTMDLATKEEETPFNFWFWLKHK